jgi:hypothetical protein
MRNMNTDCKNSYIIKMNMNIMLDKMKIMNMINLHVL